MLIRGAQLEDGAIVDVRIERDTVSAIGELSACAEEAVVHAFGGLLLPGLHDHHIHVASFAASLASVHCGPPEVTDADAFAACLQTPGEGWLRVIGYHESIAGMLDAAALDEIVCDRPVRVQHRGGRMWFFNSCALAQLLAMHTASPRLERKNDRFTGRLFDDDAWLHEALGATLPSFQAVGRSLAQVGVTGITEMSPANDLRIAQHFIEQTAGASLPQRVLLAGSLDLAALRSTAHVRVGAAKLHLHEAHLPTFEHAVAFICRAHDSGRCVAVHCTTEVELVFALAAIKDAGVLRGDRIEHASIATDFAVTEIANLGLRIVSQPHFIAERGDVYLNEIATESHPLLYRLRAFLDAGVTLAGGSDAPFGGCDPWMAMQAAVIRRTHAGHLIGADESLTPEQALDLYLRAPEGLEQRRRVAVGAPADLCLLDRPWQAARQRLSSAYVRTTFIAGRPVFERPHIQPA